MSDQSRGCGVCTARKVRCDRSRPFCNRCRKAGKLCDGYNIRLSWPRRNDGRRMTVAPPGRHAATPAGRAGASQFVHTFVWDMHVNNILSANGWDEYSDNAKLMQSIIHGHSYRVPPPDLAPLVPWIPHQLDAVEKELLQYFVSVSSHSLSAIGSSISNLRNAIIRAAFSSNTRSAAAVLQAVFALSSLHRHGFQRQAARYKVSALRCLSESTKEVLGTAEYIQNSAAGMLLCSFEVHKSDATSGHWIWYVCGSMSIIKMACSDALAWETSEFIAILGWIHYHDVLAKFSLRHWRGHGTDSKDYKREPEFNGKMIDICHIAKVPYPPGPAHETLHILLEVCETVIAPLSSTYYSSGACPSDVEALERKLQQALQRSQDHSSYQAAFGQCSDQVVELHQLAALIYLLRLSGCVADRAAKISRLVDDGFRILRSCEMCQWPFPLLMLGNEVRDDEDRMTILNVIKKTESNAYARNLQCVAAMLRIIWVQDDLAETPLQYEARLTTTLSTSDIVPTFV